MKNPNNTIVLVTGSSSGIGQAVAIYLYSVGYKVYGTSRNAKNATTEFTTLSMDLKDENSIYSTVATIIEKEGKIDVLINNAGEALMGALEDYSQQEVQSVFDTNLFGTIALTNAVLPYMRQNNSGKIINISSIGGLIGLPFRSVYCASKFAIEGISEALRLEVKPFGISVSIIEPGDVKTNINTNRTTAKKALKNSAYSKNFEFSKKLINKGVDTGIHPKKIAHRVEDIIQSKKPKLHYRVGPFIQKLTPSLKSILPSCAFEWILKVHHKIS